MLEQPLEVRIQATDGISTASQGVFNFFRILRVPLLAQMRRSAFSINVFILFSLSFGLADLHRGAMVSICCSGAESRCQLFKAFFEDFLKDFRGLRVADASFRREGRRPFYKASFSVSGWLNPEG
jgi:hypothetical protein